MLTASLLIASFMAGFFGKRIKNLAHGLWLMCVRPSEFKNRLSLMEKAAAREKAKDDALRDARARLAHIYEQSMSIDMAKKIAFKGVKNIDATQSS